MRKIFYEKIGRKYVPVAEYDNDYMDSFPKGAHLVICNPGLKTQLYNINANHAALIAASHVAEEAMSRALYAASEARPTKTPITEKQREAWLQMKKVMGEEMFGLQYESCRTVAEAGIKALIEEAEKIMQNPQAKKAYEQFLLICELSK